MQRLLPGDAGVEREPGMTGEGFGERRDRIGCLLHGHRVRARHDLVTRVEEHANQLLAAGLENAGRAPRRRDQHDRRVGRMINTRAGRGRLEDRVEAAVAVLDQLLRRKSVLPLASADLVDHVGPDAADGVVVIEAIGLVDHVRAHHRVEHVHVRRADLRRPARPRQHGYPELRDGRDEHADLHRLEEVCAPDPFTDLERTNARIRALEHGIVGTRREVADLAAHGPGELADDRLEMRPRGAVLGVERDRARVRIELLERLAPGFPPEQRHVGQAPASTQ